MINKLNASHFLSRELSWLEFNQRVITEAQDVANPLLERVKFFCIAGSNLDEFFEVRVAGVKQQIQSKIVERSVDGKTASETFREMRKRMAVMVTEQFRIWREELLPALASHNINFLHPGELEAADRAWMDTYYKAQIRPVLTPLGIDPSHPFPQLLNKSLNIAVQLEIERDGAVQRRLAVVQVPRVLPRLVQLPRDDDRRDYIFMGQLICNYITDLFPGTKILGYWHFRVTRNSELYIDEDDAGNLLSAVEEELHNRLKGAAVRLEVELECPPEIYYYLLETLELTEEDLYIIDGPLNPIRLMAIYEGDHSPELRDKPFVAPVGAPFRDGGDMFAIIRRRDVLLHHPYESFGSVVEFLERAAADPHVLAVKQTLYRTGGDPRIVGALMEAVRNGKQVTAVTELKARFDEANNIQWARKLEEAGVHVVYGIVHHKVHAKVALVVRRDEDGLRRYVHFGTGNYNPSTARTYTDLSLFTAKPEYGEDATNLFNLLTGICQFQPTNRLLIAPFTLHPTILALIAREAENAMDGKPARIIAKMNALVDQDVIAALYKASQAGVQIDLIIRGICCLRPGVPELSENIRVRSIVGRFLEHGRVYYFENSGDPKLYLASADWMPRNFFRRIETAIPVEDPELRADIVGRILQTELSDDMKAWLLGSDGVYRRTTKRRTKPRSSQAEFMDFAMNKAGKKIKHPPKVRFPSIQPALVDPGAPK